MKQIKIRPLDRVVQKGWGQELWIVNNDKYCGKILEFNAGAKFSMHYHVNKEETFYVLKGHLRLDYFDLTNAEAKCEYLRAGDVVDIPQYNPHKIEAIEDSAIVEISTHHDDCDSYRIEKGNSQK
jgi:mannose-6-phosphate isomerase-like protein (cupin superfamily)